MSCEENVTDLTLGVETTSDAKLPMLMLPRTTGMFSGMDYGVNAVDFKY